MRDRGHRARILVSYVRPAPLYRSYEFAVPTLRNLSDPDLDTRRALAARLSMHVSNTTRA